MTKRDAYQLGVESGLETATYGDFSPDELRDPDSFLSAGLEICENKRQFADSITYVIAGQKNSDLLFDAFDEGEAAGLRKGYKDRGKQS